MNRGVKIFVGILILIVLVVAIYFSFFFYYECDDLACYRAHQEECVSTVFFRDTDLISWNYKIEGKSNGECLVKVEVVDIKEGDSENEKLLGKNMKCEVDLGSSIFPESNLRRCHGELKEEIQELIIQKAHRYILDNVGEIGEELNKIE